MRGSRWAEPLLAAGVGSGLALPLLTLPPFQFGLWERTEPVLAGLCFSAALATAGLALLSSDRRGAATRHPVIVVLLLLAVWPCVAAPWRDAPWLTWFGTPSLGEGSASWLSLALLSAAVRALWCNPNGRRTRISSFWACSAITALMTLLSGARPFGFAWSLYVFPDYLAFVAPVPLALALALYGDLTRRDWLLVLGCGSTVGLAALWLSDNTTVQVLTAVSCIVICGAVIMQRRTAMVVVGSAAVLMPVAFAAAVWFLSGSDTLASSDIPAGKHVGGYSLWDRGQLIRLAAAAAGAEPIAWVFGHGWGALPQLLAVHLPIDGITLAQPDNLQPNWTAVTWLHFHSHSAWVEGWIAGGLGVAILALGLPLALLVRPSVDDRRISRCLTVGSCLALASLGVAWFQLPATLGLTGLWLGAASARIAEGDGFASRRKANLAVQGMIGLAALALAWTAWSTVDTARQAEEIRSSQTAEAPPSVPPCTLPMDDRGRGGEHGILLALLQVSEIRRAVEEGEPPDTNAWDWADRHLCGLHRAIMNGSIPPRMAVAGITLRGDLAVTALQEHQGAVLVDKLGPVTNGWEPALERVLSRFPDRADLAIGYFTWLLARGDFAEAERYARHRLAIAEHDPVALWFGGTALLSRAAPDAEALDWLNLALDAGVLRFVPIDAATQAAVREASGR